MPAGRPADTPGSVVDSSSSLNVGSFTKAIATPTAVQVVPHGLGETTKARILWTMAAPDENFATGFHLAIGASDGTFSESAATASADNLTKSDASRRMAFKALTNRKPATGAPIVPPAAALAALSGRVAPARQRLGTVCPPWPGICAAGRGAGARAVRKKDASRSCGAVRGAGRSGSDAERSS